MDVVYMLLVNTVFNGATSIEMNILVGWIELYRDSIENMVPPGSNYFLFSQ